MKKARSKYRFEFIFVIFVVLVIVLTVMNSDKLVKMLYPFPHQELILEASEKFEVDPFLILAVIKTESRFREDAVSPKGARGLMQIMPTTGQWIAEQLNVEDFHPDQLVEPEVNILFGTWYLAFLNREFNNRLEVVLASYNAGPGKVREWLASGAWDGTLSNINDIPFKETENYIARVTRHYRVYQDLYSENLSPK